MQAVSVVLVTWNHYTLTRECLRCLAVQEGVKVNLIVVDNASNDSTPDLMRKEFPQVNLIALSQNVGFGQANNIGFQQAHPGDTVVLLNNDTLPEPTFLSQLIHSMLQLQERMGTPVILAPRTVNKDGSRQRNHYTDISLGRFFLTAFQTEAQALRTIHGDLQAIEGTSISKCDWTSAICWCMTSATWKSIGGFDPAIFMYYEDVEFAWRARALGVSYFVDESIPLIHLGGGSANSNFSRSLQHDTAQTYAYEKRWGKKGKRVSLLFRMVRSGLRCLALVPFIWLPRFRRSCILHAKLLRATVARASTAI